ncbi:unnamed protein product [Closterium sp. Naga37s-1]|nr:unnamed protein product [Closterium sp. Naga37s-1]
MVIAGGPELSLERAANSQTVAEKATMATKPPLPPVPKPGTAVSEMPPPLVPAVPAAALTPAGSAPVPASSAPAAATVPLAPPVVAPATVPVAADVDPPVPAPAAPDATPAAVPAVPAPSAALSPQAASATTGGPAPMVAPLAPAGTLVAQAGQPSRPSSPDRRLSRPHSPALHQERASSRRRRDSPRRNQQQAQWPAHPGGNGSWRGPHGHGGGGRYRPPVTMADLQREVSRAVREERAAQSQSSSLRAAPAPVAPRQAEPPVAPPSAAAFPPPVLAPSAPSPSVSAPSPGSRLHLPPVPPVAGVEFVAAGGGAAAQHSHHVAADESLLFLTEALQPPQTRRDTYLDAADQLASLLAPVLDAPAEGGAAAAGQLDEAVRGLRRHLRAGSGAAAIGASTLVVRELWRSLTGVLHALGAHRM